MAEPSAAPSATARPSRSRRLARAIAFALPSAAFLLALWATWLKWGDLVVDCGRDLDTALQLSRGQVLYRDVRYTHGPLAPYVNGFLFRCFGARVEVVMAAGAVTAALMVWVLYRLARQFTNRWVAAGVAVAFVYLCAFGHLLLAGIFNFVMPYSYAAPYGMLAAASSLLFLIRHVRRGRERDFWIAAAALTLAGLAKLEGFLAAGVAHGVFVAAFAWQRRLSSKLHGLGYLTSAAVLVAVYGYFWRLIGDALLRDNLVTPGNLQARAFLAQHMGFGDLPDASSQMAVSIAAFGAALLLAWRTSRLVGTEQAKRPLHAAAAAGAAALYFFVPVFAIFRFLPLLGVLVLGALAVGWRRLDGLGPRLPHLLLWAFVLVCLARIPLKAGASHYGFYLLPVALVALAVFWFEYLPLLVAGSRRAYHYVGAAAFATIVGLHWNASMRAYALHTAELKTPRGEMRLISPPGEWYVAAVKALEAFPPHTKVLALPHGVGLTFFSGTTNPYGIHAFGPADLSGDFSEERVLERWKENPPDVVVIIGTNQAEFGVQGFGIDYAQRLVRWVEAHFEPFERIPDGDPLIQLATRKGARLERRTAGVDQGESVRRRMR